MRGGLGAVLAHGGFEALPDFFCLPGLEADDVGLLVGGVGLGVEVEALVGERSEGVG